MKVIYCTQGTYLAQDVINEIAGNITLTSPVFFREENYDFEFCKPSIARYLKEINVKELEPLTLRSHESIVIRDFNTIEQAVLDMLTVVMEEAKESALPSIENKRFDALMGKI